MNYVDFLGYAWCAACAAYLIREAVAAVRKYRELPAAKPTFFGPVLSEEERDDAVLTALIDTGKTTHKMDVAVLLRLQERGLIEITVSMTAKGHEWLEKIT